MTIVPVTLEEHLALVRELFNEYAGSLGVDLSFQGFPQEVATLPGAYAPPSGRLLLAFQEGQPAGCAGLRGTEGHVGEMKRLFVRPAFRGQGVGRALALAIIEEARQAGYSILRLDTLPSMSEAQVLYRSLGFQDIAPYRFNPILGSVFMELRLIENRQSSAP